jgi:hypothetical protein
MTEDELRQIEAKADAADIPTLTAEVRKLNAALHPPTPKFKVWFKKTLSASRVVEADSIEAAQRAGEALASGISDQDAEVVRDWTAQMAVPADE